MSTKDYSKIIETKSTKMIIMIIMINVSFDNILFIQLLYMRNKNNIFFSKLIFICLQLLQFA